jgi:hypothetical protein
MAGWRDTFWYRAPRGFSRPSVYRTVAVVVFAIIAAASLIVFALSGRLQQPLSDWALRALYRSAHFRAVLNGLEPARQAAVPARLEAVVARALSLARVAGLVGAAVAGLAVMALGRFLQEIFSASAPGPRAQAARVPRAWLWGGAMAFAAGLLAHVPFIRLSLNSDEIGAALHIRDHWFAWADTSLGWQVHAGGELLARLSVDLLGDDDRSIRIGSAVVSAAGLSVTYLWIRRQSGLIAAVLTAGLLCALPLWAEQTTLARGYGVMFFAGSVQLWALWRILDDAARNREPATLAALLVSNVIGFSGHFFYLFFALSSMELLAWHAWRRRSDLAAAGLAWSAVGVIASGPLYLLGLPATLYQSAISGHSTFAVIEQRFVEELGFRLPGRLQWVAAAAIAGCFILGLFRLQTRARHRVLVLIGISIGVPLLLRPAFFYPRFFVFLLPLFFVAALPIARTIERLPWPPARLAAAVAMAIVVWAVPKPFAMRPSFDVRAAAAALTASARPGDAIVVDNFLAVSQYYLPATLHPTYVNTKRGIPARTDVLMIGTTAGESTAAPTGFTEVARNPGRDMTISVYVADDRGRRAVRR